MLEFGKITNLNCFYIRSFVYVIKIRSMPNSTLFSYIWFKDYSQSIEELSIMAVRENWDYKTARTGRMPILANYVRHTFSQINSEKKFEILGEFSVFNTGLVTNNQEEIFGLCQKNKKPGSNIPYYFIGWRKASDRQLLRFAKLPEPANYFQNPADLIYDLKIDLRPNIEHIISDNKDRFPESLREIDDHQLSALLLGTIEDAKKRIKRNYKTAIPQFYKGKVQLLLPLCLTTKAKADLALVVEKENSVYRASTCLTLDMAINNARLIAKPDDEWLKP